MEEGDKGGGKRGRGGRVRHQKGRRGGRKGKKVDKGRRRKPGWPAIPVASTSGLIKKKPRMV